MKRCFRILPIIVLACWSITVCAQSERRADSLKARLQEQPADSIKAQLYNQLADCFRFTDAAQHQQYAVKAIETSRAINYGPGLAGGYNMLAQAYENAAHYDNAILYYDSAITKWVQLGREADEAKMYLNVANVYNKLGDYPTATDYVLRSLKKQEKLKNTFGIAACKLTLGNIYYTQNDFQGALKAYKEAYAGGYASGSKMVDFEGAVLGNIGAMYQQMENYDSALYYIRLSIASFEKNGLHKRTASAYNNIGACFRKLNQYDSAMYYGRKGYAIYKDADRPEGVASALLALGVTEEKLGNIDSALDHYQNGLRITKEIKTRGLESNFYSGLSAVYKKKRDFEKALYYLERYMNLEDSLTGEESTASIDNMEKRYEIDKKNKELVEIHEAKIKSEEENKRNIIFFTCIGILLFGIIIVVVLMLRNKSKLNAILGKKNSEISQQKEEITASITYASRIQKSVMPDERILKKTNFDYFILNKPRDIVSGDFYWLAEKEGRTYIAVSDCTGHGVPGALVSVIGINLLNKIIESPGKPSPSEILELLHVYMIHALNKDADARDTSDGMDIALLCIDATSKKAIFSGAGRPLYFIDKTGFHLIKGDRYSIAGEKKEGDAPFSETEISITDKTTFYLSSDGYVDQFGETTGKKYLSKNFHELLANVSSLPMNEQEERIEKEFLGWKGSLEQVDDVLVVGVKV